MAASLLRIHSETVCLLARAAASIICNSSDVRRTRRNFPLDTPLGNFGLPGFRLVSVAFGTALVLLKDYGLHGGLRRYYRRNVQHGHISLSLFRIVGIVRPAVNAVGHRMVPEPEHLHDTFPNRSSLMRLSHRNAFNMRGLCTIYLNVR